MWPFRRKKARRPKNVQAEATPHEEAPGLATPPAEEALAEEALAEEALAEATPAEEEPVEEMSEDAIKEIADVLRGADATAEIKLTVLGTLPVLRWSRGAEHLAFLRKDSDAEVSQGAEELLHNARNRELPIRADMLRSRDARERELSLDVLGRMKDRRAFEVVAGALEDDEWMVRQAAMRALSRLGDERAVELLVAVVESGESHERLIGLNALAGLRVRSERSRAAAMAAAADPDPDVRGQAAYVLGTQGPADEDALDVLLALLEDEQAEPRWQALKALGEAGSARAVPAVVRCLDSEVRRVRSVACDVLAALGDDRAMPFLVAHIGNSHRERSRDFPHEEVFAVLAVEV